MATGTKTSAASKTLPLKLTKTSLREFPAGSGKMLLNFEPHKDESEFPMSLGARKLRLIYDAHEDVGAYLAVHGAPAKEAKKGKK